MTLIDVLDHCDLKLARQKHDREHGQESQRGPRRVIHRAAAKVEQLGELRIFDRAGEYVGKAVVQHISRIHTDCDESEQLDHGFERDGSDQAFVALGRVEMAGTEQDGEYRQQ